jgi:hypothetical protein
VPLLRRAYEGWHELAQESGRGLLRLCGGIYIGDPESPVFAGSLASARLHGLEHEVLDALADVDLARRKRSRPTLLEPVTHWGTTLGGVWKSSLHAAATARTGSCWRSAASATVPANVPTVS